MSWKTRDESLDPHSAGRLASRHRLLAHQTARSVWSAWSLLPLSNRATHPTAGASSTHSIRFARHDRPCHPSVQFALYPPKICAKKQDFRLYYLARRRNAKIAGRRAEDPARRDALPAAAIARHWVAHWSYCKYAL